MITLAKKLKELRLGKGLSQSDVANVLSIKQQSYLRYELGTGEPSLEALIKLAKFYDVTTDYLLGLESL